MKITPSRCPECGGEIRGAVVHLYAIALVNGFDDESFEYADQTVVDWDTSETMEGQGPGTVLIQCVNYCEFDAVIEEV